MNIVLRYVCLLGLGVASLSGFISAGAVTGQMAVSGMDQAYVDPRDMAFWVLGIVATISLFSVVRFLFARIPFMIRDWYRGHKDKLATLAMAGVICIVFVVF